MKNNKGFHFWGGGVFSVSTVVVMSSPTAKRQKLGNLETALVSATNHHVSAHAASGQLQPRPPRPVCCPSNPCDLALLLLSPQANEIQSDESVTVKGVAVPMVIECKEGAKLDAVLAWVGVNQPALEAKLKVSGVLVTVPSLFPFSPTILLPWRPHFLRFTAPYCSGTFPSQRSSILMTLSRPSM